MIQEGWIAATRVLQCVGEDREQIELTIHFDQLGQCDNGAGEPLSIQSSGGRVAHAAGRVKRLTQGADHGQSRLFDRAGLDSALRFGQRPDRRVRAKVCLPRHKSNLDERRDQFLDG